MANVRPFRKHDAFEVICAKCGAEFLTTEKTGVCRCGVAFEIVWQAVYKPEPRAAHEV